MYVTLWGFESHLVMLWGSCLAGLWGRCHFGNRTQDLLHAVHLELNLLSSPFSTYKILNKIRKYK